MKGDAFKYLLEVMRQLNQAYDTIHYYDRAIAENPDIPIAWMRKGYAADLASEYGISEDAYAQVVRISPQSTEGWTNLGFARFQQGNYYGAIDAFNSL
mgnify:FL=1